MSFKSVGKVPHKKLLCKVKQIGINGNVHNLVRNWLSNRKQRSVINDTASDWAPVMRSVAQCSVLRSVLFIIYISDIDVGLNTFISKLAEEMKIGNWIIDDRDRVSLQEDPRKISEWSQRWKMPFNVNKCHILQVGTRNKEFDFEMNGVKLEIIPCVKDLGVSISSNLNSPGNAKTLLVKPIEYWASYKQKSFPLRVKI